MENILILEQFYRYFVNLYSFTSGDFILTRQWVLSIIFVSTLYVADLPSEVTEIYLFQIFSTTGTITSIRICKDKLSGESLGHANVNFKSQEEAHHALYTLNFHMINGSPIRLMWSHRGPSIRKSNEGNIFIHNLPPDVDSKSYFDVY